PLPSAAHRIAPKSTMKALDAWHARVRDLKQDTYALYLAYRDPQTPWYAKVWAACVVAYAFSPIDLIPDVVPVLGYVDDLLLVPLGIWLAVRMIPAPVMAACRVRAVATMTEGRPAPNWAAAAAVIAVWLLLAATLVVVVWQAVRA
ncbi:MAG: YkvA family protein, partial [Anaerolineae bacterium]